jgi:hypothetical protein
MGSRVAVRRKGALEKIRSFFSDTLLTQRRTANLLLGGLDV